jgi:hypothetical protein
MTIEPQAPIQVRKVANGFIITPAAGDEFVSDAVTLVFSDEVGVTKWLCQHFEPAALGKEAGAALQGLGLLGGRGM